MAVKVTIDKSLCIGCAACTAVCPAVFAMGDDGLAEVVEGADLSDAAIEDAAAGCPCQAIIVE
ncbi:MAG: ferredoxin [Bacilli bacterium]|nr:ferredoxin [Bacilli bacterium]